MPQPIRNKLNKNTGKTGNNENKRAPQKARIQAKTRLFFSSYFCTIIPEGIDIKAYAMKNEKGNSPVIAPLRSKLSLTFGLIEPRILVRKEIAKKIKKISTTR